MSTSGLAERDRRHLERRANEEACRKRWVPIAGREMELGLRVVDFRKPFKPGERVLHNYPPREGVVITYEESDGHHGSPNGFEELVRYPDGSVGLIHCASLVSLDLEEAPAAPEEEQERAAGGLSLR